MSYQDDLTPLIAPRPKLLHCPGPGTSFPSRMWARVSATYLYPIKACAPLRVTSLSFDDAGAIRDDRTWVVVDADNRLTWLGAIPTLAHITPVGPLNRLALASPDGDAIALPPPGECVPRTIQAWNGSRQAFDDLAGRDAGDPVANFASAIARQKVRLVHLATSAHRPNPVHLITDSSLHALAAETGGPIDLLRFRPNIILTGDGAPLAPYLEERTTALVCSTPDGPLTLSVTTPCERCVVINVDPASSAVDAHYLKTVVAQSRERRGSTVPVFGIYARPTAQGTLAVGDRVEVLTAQP